MPQNKRMVGRLWESLSREYLMNKGYTILFMNYRTRYSEIDIVAQDGEELVFIEVKYRRSRASGDPLEAVDYNKQRRIINAALCFLNDMHYDVEKTAIRFDVIGILDDKIDHIRNAYGVY